MTTYDLSRLPTDLPPLALAVGVFDGVHKGHQALLARAVQAAPEVGAVPAALTFHPHPAAVFSPSRVPPLLTTLEQRTDLLHAHGAQVMVVARFDAEFAAQTPEQFVREVLLERLHARAVIVGDDFHYGCYRRGNVSSLQAAGARHGFMVHVLPTLLQNGVPVRSTVIRGMVNGGAVEEAAALMGRFYRLTGVVVRGRQMGRTLGFPTANVASPPEVLVPGAGVYAGRVRAQGVWRRAAVSVGTNPTVVDEGARTVEAYLLDGFDGDLYDESVVVEFIAFLRAHEKFDSVEALVVQMRNDVSETERRVKKED